MSLVEINWNPEKKELRKFGLIALAVLGALSIILRFRFGIASIWALMPGTAGLCICLITLISAKAARTIYLGLTFAALPIGFVVSILLMGIFYFLVLTPIGIIFKLLNRDLLDRKFLPSAPTYWSRRENAADKERYFHQF
jgi:MFS family permease